MNCEPNEPGAARRPTPSRKAALVFAALLAAAAGYYLWSARPEQFFAALPFLALLICPVSMLIMMRGMSSGGHADSSGHNGSEPSAIQKLEAR